MFPRVPASNIITPVIGGTPSRSVSRYWGGPIKWAAAKDVVNARGRYIYSTEESITTEGLDKSAAKILPKGTVVITARGTVGAIAQLGEEMAFNQTCYGLATKKEVLPDFLYYAMKGSFAEMQTLFYGTVFDTITIKSFDQLTIPLPSLSEQQAIAHILGTLDDKIELNRRMNETLEAIARAIFKSWFIDFDPVRAKMEGRLPAPGDARQAGQPTGMDAETAALFPNSFENSPMGKIPKGWYFATIGTEFNLIMGQSPPGETYNEIGEGLPFFQGRTDFGFRFPTQRVYCTAPTRQANPGDTIVSVRAPVGDINVVLEPCCIGRGVAAIRHKSGSRSYTFYMMHSLRDTFADFEGEGTVFGCINKNDFQEIKRITPPAELIKKFEQTVFPLDEAIKNNDLSSHALAAIRDAQLPKLLSGEIKTTDISSEDDK